MEQGIEIILGAFLPPAIDFINRKILDARLRFLSSLLISIVAGLALSYGRLSFVDVEEILGSAGIIFASAQTVYKTYYKSSGLRTRLMGK